MGLGEGHGWATSHEIPESRVIREAYNSEATQRNSHMSSEVASGEPHEALEFPTPGAWAELGARVVT